MDLCLSKYVHNCRVCLKANNAYKNIFNHMVEGYQEPVVQLLFSLFNVELNPHKAYPQFICRKCLTELENILLFKEDLVRNQEFLFGLFNAAYPNCVEKRDPDFFIVTENFNKQYAQNASLECCDFDKRVVVKTESFSTPQVDNAAEQNANIECKDCNKTVNSNETFKNRSSTRIEQGQKDNINVEKNTENANKHSITEHIKTDENRNIPCINVQYQEHQDSIDKDIDDANKVAIPITSTRSHFDNIIPQISFLQKLDLITLEDAKNLKTEPKPLLRTRRRFISKKSKLPKVASTSIGSVQTRVDKSISTSRKKQLDHKGSPDILINRSIHFVSRYGCRKLNRTYLKQFKNILERDTISAVPQRDKNLNTRNKVSRKKELSLGSNSLFNKSDESKAVSKQKGCEHVNSLQNNLSCRKQSISSSTLKLDVNNIENCKQVDSFKDINYDIYPTEHSKVDKQKTLTQNMRCMEASSKTGRNVTKNPIINPDLLVKSNTASPVILYELESPGEYRTIPSKNFYESDNFHNIAKSSYQATAVERSISSRNLKKLGGMMRIKTNNSVKTESPVLSDLNTTLFLSASLESLPDFKEEIKEDNISIDDSRALVPNNVQRNDPEIFVKTISKLKSEPLTYISSGDLSQVQSCTETFDIVDINELPNELSFVTGEEPINLLNSENNVEFNLRSKRHRYSPKYFEENTTFLGSYDFKNETNLNIDTNTSPKSSEASLALRKKSGLSKTFKTVDTGGAYNTTTVLDITKNGTNGISPNIYNSKPQENQKKVHNYSLRSKMSSINIDSSPSPLNRSGNIYVDKQKLELEKTTTCVDVLNKQACERTTIQQATKELIRQKSKLSEIKSELSDNANEILELSRSHLLNQQSCQRRSRRLVSQKSKLSEIKTESSGSAEEISEPSRSYNGNRTHPFGTKYVVLNSSVGRESGNSTSSRTKPEKTVSSENLSILKHKTQGTQNWVNGYKGISQRNLFIGKVRKINMTEGEELHLTSVHTNLKQEQTSENVNYSELDTYPATRLKVEFETKATEKSNSYICDPPDNHELVQNKSYSCKRSKSCTNLPYQTISGECKRKTSLDNAPCSKRKRRPPVKYSPISYEKPRVYYYKGHIRKLYHFGNKKL